MSFWSGETLSEWIPKFGIVEPFDEKQIDCAAYTLRIGPEYYATSDNQSDAKKWISSGLKELAKNDSGELGEAFIIPSGQFAFLLTEETVRLPSHVLGFISLKSKTKFRGLVNVSGFHVDPGYHGRLIFSVYNAGPSSIILRRGEDLFLLWLADLDIPDSKEIYRADRPRLHIDPKIANLASGEVKSPEFLYSEIKRIENSVKGRIYTLTTIFSVLGALAGIIITILLRREYGEALLDWLSGTPPS